MLYSSGTTGLPKPIVHGQGGILLEHLKKMWLHLDAHPEDRVFWFTTTGWMMWNFLVGVLLTDASIVLFDGNPAGDVLWDLAQETQMTVFGTSAAYIAAAMKDGAEPAKGRDLALHAVGVTGSPLAPEGFQWVYDQLGSDTWLFSTSGGTDVCTAFVGGVPTLPVYKGELQARCLGASIESWDEQGRPHVNTVGELVITQPMPSMPVFFWGDEDGSKLREAYFEMYPGIWRHGDWIEITEALVVDLDGHMPLFVVLAPGAQLDEDLTKRIAARIREHCSPRHVPNEVHQIAEVPRTLSGKILEVPVKKILMGTPPDQAASRESLANPQALDPFVTMARHGS